MAHMRFNLPTQGPFKVILLIAYAARKAPMYSMKVRFMCKTQKTFKKVPDMDSKLNSLGKHFRRIIFNNVVFKVFLN